MLVSDIAGMRGFCCVAGEAGLGREIGGVYIGDLLSWVMGKAKQNDAWITILGHINVIAVALLTDVSCVIIAEGAEINADTIARAESEGIPLLATGLSSYEVARIFMECD